MPIGRERRGDFLDLVLRRAAGEFKRVNVGRCQRRGRLVRPDRVDRVAVEQELCPLLGIGVLLTLQDI